MDSRFKVCLWSSDDTLEAEVYSNMDLKGICSRSFIFKGICSRSFDQLGHLFGVD
jgi:hypothetical protein